MLVALIVTYVDGDNGSQITFADDTDRRLAVICCRNQEHTADPQNPPGIGHGTICSDKCYWPAHDLVDWVWHCALEIQEILLRAGTNGLFPVARHFNVEAEFVAFSVGGTGAPCAFETVDTLNSSQWVTEFLSAGTLDVEHDILLFALSGNSLKRSNWWPEHQGTIE